ncbi:MAG: ketol-acid reductoisomerase [candidate division Zixibacteria bacterium]|nr:ketol-acid reductoisomerase [candidate division Zixibacteria bacterium]
MAGLTVYYDKDADLRTLNGKKVAVIGYGSQGKAQSANLRDSKIEVILGLPSTRSRKRARKDGFESLSVPRAVERADIITFLFPDQKHKQVFEEDIEPNLHEGQTLMFAHGLSVHFGLVKPPDGLDVVMVAPHSPGVVMRRRFEEGRGVAAFFGIHTDYSGHARNIALAYAKAIGCTRSGVFETTFEHEAVGDIFGEQTALCGGLTELLKGAFEELVLGGIPPTNAYLECVQQLDLIVELIKKNGIAGMYDRISTVAEYGSYTIEGRVINDKSKRAMRAILKDIKKGKFVENFMKDYQKGSPDYLKKKAKQQEHPINHVGEIIRSKIKD